MASLPKPAGFDGPVRDVGALMPPADGPGRATVPPGRARPAPAADRRYRHRGSRRRRMGRARAWQGRAAHPTERPPRHRRGDARSPRSRDHRTRRGRCAHAPMLPGLPSQVPAHEPIATVTAGGACQARACQGAIAGRGADAIIPPRRDEAPWASSGSVGRSGAGGPDTVAEVAPRRGRPAGSRPAGAGRPPASAPDRWRPDASPSTAGPPSSRSASPSSTASPHSASPSPDTSPTFTMKNEGSAPKRPRQRSARWPIRRDDDRLHQVAWLETLRERPSLSNSNVEDTHCHPRSSHHSSRPH